MDFFIACHHLSVLFAHLQFSLASAQTAVFALAMLGFLVAHMWWRPYESRSFFLAELGSMACLLVTAILATLAQGSASGAPVALQDAAGITMILINIATVLALVLLYARAFVSAHKGALARMWMAVRRRSAKLGCACCQRCAEQTNTPATVASSSKTAESACPTRPRQLVHRVAALPDDLHAGFPHPQAAADGRCSANAHPAAFISSDRLHHDDESKATAKAAPVAVVHAPSARLSAAFLFNSNEAADSASFAAQAAASAGTSRRIAAAPTPLPAPST